MALSVAVYSFLASLALLLLDGFLAEVVVVFGVALVDGFATFVFGLLSSPFSLSDSLSRLWA